MLTDAREQEQFRRMRRRFATVGGTGVNVPVVSATSVVATFPRAEVDTAYGVTVAPTWDTRWWVSAKATDGFTVQFSATSGASDTIDYITFRTED